MTEYYFQVVIISQRKQEIFIQKFVVRFTVLTCEAIIDCINYLTRSTYMRCEL